MFCCMRIFLRFFSSNPTILSIHLSRSVHGWRCGTAESQWTRPAGFAIFVEVFWNNSFLPHETILCSKFFHNSFFPPFFLSKLEAVEKGGRHLNRKDFHHRHFRHSLLWKSSDTFLPRTWGSKTIPRRSLAASSRGKIRREWQSCLEMSRSRFFWLVGLEISQWYHTNIIQFLMQWIDAVAIVWILIIYITHTSPTSPGNISRFYVDCFSLRLSWIHLELMVAGWLMVPSWTCLTSVDFDLQGSVPKETKSWPQRKWNSKSFVLSLEPLDIFGSFTDVSICFYSSLSISLEPLEFQK